MTFNIVSKGAKNILSAVFLSQGLALTINGFDEGMKTKIMQIHGLLYG